MVSFTHWGVRNKTPWCHPLAGASPARAGCTQTQGAHTEYNSSSRRLDISSISVLWCFSRCHRYYRDIQDLSVLHLRLRGAPLWLELAAHNARAHQHTEVSWQGILHRQHNPQTPLQRQNTLKPLQKCKSVALSLFANCFNDELLMA